MGIMPEFIAEKLRDKIAIRLQLRGGAITDRILLRARELGDENSPLTILAAIGIIEHELLTSQYDKMIGQGEQDRIYRAIVEQMHFRRSNTLGRDLPTCAPADRRELDTRIREQYRELKDATARPSGSCFMVHELEMMEHAMWDCIAEIESDTLEMHMALVMAACRIGYTCKLEILNYRTP